MFNASWNRVKLAWIYDNSFIFQFKYQLSFYHHK